MENLKNLIIAIIFFGAFGISASCAKESPTDTIQPSSESDILFNPNLTYGTMTDQDGNDYKTITIGTQTWMAENLRVTHFRNGDEIPEVTDNADWSNISTSAYCNYNNTTEKTEIETYGRLYNWYAASDNRNIAPGGWHVPTNAECATLITQLGGINVAGGKMKEQGTTHWLEPNTGATNESGYTAIPAGFRDYNNGAFEYAGSFGHWWTCTEENNSFAWNIATFFLEAPANQSTSNKRLGFSIRCIKD